LLACLLPSFLPSPIWVLNNKSITLTQHDNWPTSKKLNNNEHWVGLWVIRALLSLSLSLSLSVLCKLGQQNTDILFWESWNDEHEITHDLISLSLLDLFCFVFWFLKRRIELT
jgi:hypothetical protein